MFDNLLLLQEEKTTKGEGICRYKQRECTGDRGTDTFEDNERELKIRTRYGWTTSGRDMGERKPRYSRFEEKQTHARRPTIRPFLSSLPEQEPRKS